MLPSSFQAGQRLSADDLTSMVQEISRTGSWASGAPLAIGSGPGGFFAADSSGVKWMWIKLTGGGTSGKYAWTEQLPDDSGAWADGQDSGTTSDDPAYESNGNEDVELSPAPIVRAKREPLTNTVVFTSGICS